MAVFFFLFIIFTYKLHFFSFSTFLAIFVILLYSEFLTEPVYNTQYAVLSSNPTASTLPGPTGKYIFASSFPAQLERARSGGYADTVKLSALALITPFEASLPVLNPYLPANPSFVGCVPASSHETILSSTPATMAMTSSTGIPEGYTFSMTHEVPCEDEKTCVTIGENDKVTVAFEVFTYDAQQQSSSSSLPTTLKARQIYVGTDSIQITSKTLPLGLSYSTLGMRKGEKALVTIPPKWGYFAESMYQNTPLITAIGNAYKDSKTDKAVSFATYLVLKMEVKEVVKNAAKGT